MTLNAFQTALVSRFSAILFLVGKLIRTLFFLLFLSLLVGKTRTLAGYGLYETIFFFLTFNIIDTSSQLFLREVYRLRPMVVSGSFDLVLVKPINTLFRILAGGADLLDMFMLIPYIGATLIVANLTGNLKFVNSLFYVILLMSSFIIAVSFHILVAAIGVLTTEIDHTIMIYRDITSTGRVPIDIYREPLRGFLTFVIPVGVMMTFPAKVFLGLLTPFGIVISILFSSIFFWASLTLWKYALTKYASASS